jgi:hypothetical protein
MSYPQPSADNYALNGYQYFRLNSPLSSAGDIYESTQSGQVFAIGPDSDISRVNVAYFDDQSINAVNPTRSTFMNQVTISPSRAFVGRIDAQNQEKYSPSGRPGRIMFWPDDIWDPTYVPSAAVGYVNGDILLPIVPRLDVVQYFTSQPGLNPRRSDRQYDFTFYKDSTQNWIIVPAYGRKYGYVSCLNKNPTTAYTFRVIGVTYSLTGDATETVIHSAALAAGAHVAVSNFLGNAPSPSGSFDALAISVTPYQGFSPLRVYLSDEP